MGRRVNKGKRELLDFFDTVLQLKDVTSLEHYPLEGGAFRPVIRDLSLEVRKGESWAIYGEKPLDLKLLLEIMGNIIPMGQGSRTLLEESSSHKLRRILDSVFYIGGSGMLIPNMNVLEALMFATAPQKGDTVLRQEDLFETLIDLGLGHLSLTPVHLLTSEESALVTLLTAAYSDSPLILFNLPQLSFDDLLLRVLASISEFITLNDKALVLSTTDSLLVERTCDFTVFLHEGQVLFAGSVAELLTRYDKTLIILEDDESSSLLDPLTQLLPQQAISLEDGQLIISDREGQTSDPLALHQRIVEAGLAPGAMAINHKSAKAAFKALGRSHDL